MSTFKAVRIDKDDAGYRANFVTMDDSELMEGDVTVRVTHSTVNYKDGLAITGKSPVVRKFPMIPGVDFCGVHVAEVVALGFAPVPPQRTSEGEEGEEGCGDKATEAKNFLARAAAAAVAAGSEGAASSAAAPADKMNVDGERAAKAGGAATEGTATFVSSSCDKAGGSAHAMEEV
jgi:hypothetical protein